MGIKFLIFLPFLEIIIFIFFGDIIGFGNTILLIFITGLLGIWLLLPTKTKLQFNFNDVTNINNIDWFFRRISGILILVPGFLTDFIGLILLLKFLRPYILSFLPKTFSAFSKKEKNDKQNANNNPLTDIEYKDLDK